MYKKICEWGAAFRPPNAVAQAATVTVHALCVWCCGGHPSAAGTRRWCRHPPCLGLLVCLSHLLAGRQTGIARSGC